MWGKAYCITKRYVLKDSSLVGGVRLDTADVVGFHGVQGIHQL